jgi:general stress protein YciG
MKHSHSGSKESQRGGLATSATHDHAHYVQIGHKGGTKTNTLHGPDHFSKASKIGKEVIMRKYGVEHYRRMVAVRIQKAQERKAQEQKENTP